MKGSSSWKVSDMKRVLAILVLALLSVTLIGCKSDAVKHVEGMIEALGTVTLDSADALDAAKNALLSLTEKERKQVNNADVLIEAFQTLDELKAQAIADAYTEADTLLQKGEYAKAHEAFAALGDYEKSAEKLEEAARGLRYLEAVALVDAGTPYAARTTFRELGDFEDSKAYLERFKVVSITEENWETYFYLGDVALFVDDAAGQIDRLFLCYGLFPTEAYAATLTADGEQQVTVTVEYDCKQVDLIVDRAAHTYEVYTTLSTKKGQQATIVFDNTALRTGGTYDNFFAAAAAADGENLYASYYSMADDAKAWGYGMELTEFKVTNISGSITIFE